MRGFGSGFLDLKLSAPLAFDDTVTLTYVPGTVPFKDMAGTVLGTAPGMTPGFTYQVWMGLAPTSTRTTDTGANVVVAPPDAGTGSQPATLTFSDVTMAGTTTLTANRTAPPLPVGYQLQGTYYDLQTTALYSGGIRVCFSYPGAPAAPPTALLHYDSTIPSPAWVPIQDVPAASGDTTANRICGTTQSLSPFALVTPTPTGFYRIAGFSQPLNDPAGTNPSVFKAGSTIVVKFALTDANGTRIPDAEASALATACGATISFVPKAGTAPSVDEAVTSTTPNSGSCFRYDSTAHQFIFNLGTTKGLAAGAQYMLTASIVGPDRTTLLATHQLAIGVR